ncbi:hypothetical protein E3N88_00049 [Mikania micrantha]|uniref:Uncharacterized protein n=1 Tax=Mikania micrantha TaxID=192012 RepID=A0A5N6PXV4_9ASTR|nr:hypothetical protein E3N88_00049 [Mikania micrantha]
MEQTIYSQIVVPVVKFLKGHLTKHLGYVIFSSKYVRAMKEQLRVLKNTRDNVEKQKQTNDMDNKEIPVGVSAWLNAVETFKNEFESISSEGYGCLNIKMRHKTGKKACEATEMIKRFTKEKKEFEWTNAPIPTGIVYSKTENSTPSSHGVNFKSRYRPFNEALKWLQQDNNKSQVIALCGMGGVGKTTMMEQLETEANNKKMFDYIVPIVIGRTHNMHSIQNDISIRLSGEGLVEATIPERAHRLREKFKIRLEEKKERILFILDDVWQKIELKDIGLTSPLPNGLKLFLTSRDSDICRQIAVSAHSHTSFKVVEVEILTEEEAQNLFFKITNVSKEDNRYDIGCQIVEKCGRLPIAINIIGTALQSQEMHFWNSKLQRLNNNNIDHDLQEVIKISYEYIDKEHKEVLLLCGLFPEDYDIRIEDLTRYAWGLNLFKGVSTLGGARDSTRTCLGTLIYAHMLIKSNKHGCVRMHDLVLSFVLGVVSKSDRAWIINHGNVTQLAGGEEACKRISLTCKGMSEFAQDFKYPNLSLLQLMNGDLSLKFPEDFYENMKKLQVIAYYDMESPLMISKSLHCSTNLKSLCLYRCKLMFDFSFVGDLVNLEVLSFAYCDILKLPCAIGKLVKLKLLDLTGCLNLHVDNGVFENLKNLKEIYMIKALTDSNFEKLAMLSKQLCALEVEFVDKKNQLNKISFENLDNFKIAIGCSINSYKFKNDPFENVLELVSDRIIDLCDSKINQLFKKTEHLELSVKDMTCLKDLHQIGQHSFSTLKSLMVYDCSNLKYLFRVANGLKKLERLTVRKCNVLEVLIQKDESEISGVVELPQLLVLELYDLPNFTSIYPDNNNNMCALFNSQVKFAKLEILNIENMGKLKQIWDCEFVSSDKVEVNNISMLREIEVVGCDSLENLFPTNPMRLLTHLEKLKVISCGSIKDLFNINVEYNVSMLREIEVTDCDSLVNLFPTNPMRLLTRLEKLQVECCGSIEVIFKIDLGYEFEQVSMNNFRRIQVLDSKNVREVWRIRGGEKNSTSIRGFESVEFISIERCGRDNKKSREDEDVNISTVAFPSNIYFHSLRDLKLNKFEGVEVVFELDLNNQQPLFPNLQSLDLHEMNDMSHVWKCNNWNKYLLNPQRHYHSFHSLTSINIRECNRIKYLFSPLMAKLLSNLQKIKIRSCHDMEEVVSNRDDDDDNDEEEMSSTSTTTTFFPHLQSLTFEDLTNLTRIGGGAKGAKTGVIHDQFKASHVGVVSWSLCQYSKEIVISFCNGLSSVIPSNAIGQMQKLEVLRVRHCKLLKVFETKDIHGNSGDGKSSTNIDEESVGIDVISRQANINVTRLSNLKIMEIRSCNSLVFVFTFSMLESLKQLEELIVIDCKSMKVIVEKENGEDRKDVVFPWLKFLSLESLPNLEGFFLGMNNFNWPLLEKVKIIKCPQMMNFTCGESTTPVLEGIHRSLGRYSLECGLNIHMKTHQTSTRFLITVSSARGGPRWTGVRDAGSRHCCHPMRTVVEVEHVDRRWWWFEG